MNSLLNFLICFHSCFLLVTASPPIYPLYAIDSLPESNLSDDDLFTIATNFSSIQGWFTSDQLAKMLRFNPKFGPVSYINTDAAVQSEVEPVSRFGVGYYLTGHLLEDLSADASEVHVIPVEGTSPLKQSTVSGNFSKAHGQYVTFIRIDDELLRIDEVTQESSFARWSRYSHHRNKSAWSRFGFEALQTEDFHLNTIGRQGETAVLRVTRGFGGSEARSHKASSSVFAPMYNSEGFPGGTAKISYMVDPTTDFGVTRMVNHTLQVVSDGYAGSWFDCFSAAQYNAVDMGGKRMKHSWDFSSGAYFTAETFLAAQKKRLSAYWSSVHANLSYFPLTLANNLNAGYWPDRGNDRSMLIPVEGFRPLDGYCMESFIGKEMLNDPYSYGCNVSALNFTWLEHGPWRANVQRLMDAAQNGLAALPMLAQAGCKSVKLEIMPDLRDQIETYAYASYLLAVNSSSGPTRLGIPAFYQANGKRFAHVHERYSWPIGEPETTFSPGDIDKYRPNSYLSYVREFTNGVIIVNPFNTTDHSLALGKTYVNPATHQHVSVLDVPANTGMLLLNE